MKKRIQAIVKRSMGKKLSYDRKFYPALTVPILMGLLNVPLSRAQLQTEPKLSFEVVSIKPAPNCDGSRPAELAPGRMVRPCVRLRGLIRTAYSTFVVGGRLDPQPLDVLGGPQWIDADTFYLQAKTEDKVTIEQMYGPMLRALLEDRFKLKVRKELRDRPVYELTVVKRNPSLQPTKAGSCIERAPNDFSIPSKLEDFSKQCGTETLVKPKGEALNPNGMKSVNYHGLSMSGLAMRINPSVGRPVIDKTGLTGLFDFHLEYVPARSGPVSLNGAARPDIPDSTDDANGPSIYTALKEQLGLKLSPANGKVEVVIIDNVEKPSPD